MERKQEAITNVRGGNAVTNGENYRSESPTHKCNREEPPNFEDKIFRKHKIKLQAGENLILFKAALDK